MKKQLPLQFTVTDQYGSRARVGGVDLNRITHSHETARLYPEFYGEEPFTSCPACGTTPESVKATSLVGCPICYTTIYSTNLTESDSS